MNNINNPFNFPPPYLNNSYFNSHNNYFNKNYSNNYFNKFNNEKIIEMNEFQNKNTKNKKDEKWFKISNGKIKLFNFNIESDDILLIGLIIFLLLQKEKDYILIIIIALMIFNLSIDDLKELNFLESLKNFF